jgi:histone H3/H4
MEFSKAKMKELLKSSTDKRISEDASQELGDVLEMFAGDVAEEVIAVAKEDGRKTLRKEDVRKALR